MIEAVSRNSSYLPSTGNTPSLGSGRQIENVENVDPNRIIDAYGTRASYVAPTL